MIPAMRRGLSSRWKTIKLSPAPNTSQFTSESKIDNLNNQKDGLKYENEGYISISNKEDLKYPIRPSIITNNLNNLNIPDSISEDVNKHEKKAGDAFALDELYDLNGETFWYFILFYLISFISLLT